METEFSMKQQPNIWNTTLHMTTTKSMEKQSYEDNQVNRTTLHTMLIKSMEWQEHDTIKSTKTSHTILSSPRNI